MRLVLFRKHQLGGIESLIAFEGRPLDADRGVIPHQAALVVGMVDVVALVAELGLVGKH